MASRQQNKESRDRETDYQKISAAQDFIAAYHIWRTAKELHGMMTEEEDAAFQNLKEARKRFKRLQSR